MPREYNKINAVYRAGSVCSNIEEDIRNIRCEYAEGKSQRKITAKYGVKQGAIWLILKGKTYNWVK